MPRTGRTRAETNFASHCGKGWVTLGVANVVTAAPSPHPPRTGPGHPVRGGRWAGPSNSENGSEPLAGAFEIFIFILSRSQSQVGLRPRRPTRDGHKGAHPHTLPNVNVGGARPPHGRCKSGFTSRSFYFKNNTHFFFRSKTSVPSCAGYLVSSFVTNLRRTGLS